MSGSEGFRLAIVRQAAIRQLGPELRIRVGAGIGILTLS